MLAAKLPYCRPITLFSFKHENLHGWFSKNWNFHISYFQVFQPMQIKFGKSLNSVFHITLENCALIHLVKVFCCTASCSSVKQKGDGVWKVSRWYINRIIKRIVSVMMTAKNISTIKAHFYWFISGPGQFTLTPTCWWMVIIAIGIAA